MAYATLDDLKKQAPEADLIALTDDEGSGAINQGRIDDALASADALIDAHAGVRLEVPFADPIPDLIRRLSIDIALYNLHARRQAEVGESIKARYQAAVRTLESIASGLVNPLSEKAGRNRTETNVDDDTQTFTRKSMRGF